MSIIIKLQDIDEAIENLRYKSETTQKAKLLRAVRQYYTDDASSESLPAIDTEELVKTIWETGDDRELLKAKRKNFSSLKSGVNSDLKKLYTGGKNPQGIVIGPANTFVISDEAKDKALSGIMDVFKEKGIDTTSKLTDILSALGDVLSSAVTDSAAIDAKDEIDRLKHIMDGLSEKLGVSPEDLIRRAEAAGGKLSGMGDGAPDLPAKSGNLSNYIREGISDLDKELHGLAGEVREAPPAGLKESIRQALADIMRTLKDSEADAAGKAEKILTAVDRILADAIESAGDDLSGEQASELKKIFTDMREGAKDSPHSDWKSGQDTAVPAVGSPSGIEPAAPGTAELSPRSGDQLLADVASILGEGGEGPGDKISRIMAAVNDMIGDALARSGLSGEEVAQIQEMMGNIAGNLEAFAHEALAEEDIIEEIIEDDEGQIDQVVSEAEDDAKTAGSTGAGGGGEAAVDEVVWEEAEAAPDEIVEIVEEAPGEVFEDAVQSDEIAAGGATSGGENADFIGKAGEEGGGQSAESLDDAVGVAGEAEDVEIIEEIIEEESVAPGAEAQTITEDVAGESPTGEENIIEVIEEIAGEELTTSEAEPQAVEETAGEASGSEVVEISEEISDNPEVLPEKAEAAPGIEPEDAPGLTEVVDEAMGAGADAFADEIVEVVEESAGEAVAGAGEDAIYEKAVEEAFDDVPMEGVEVDEAIPTDAQDIVYETVSEDGQTGSDAGGDVISDFADSDLIEEIVEDAGAETAGVEVASSDKPVDEELREKTDLLSRLAQAAGVLEKLGPDLSGSVYTEDELRGKAKFLSEEFDRYLSIRDKFFNAHILIKSGDYLVGGAHLAKSELQEQIVSLPDFYIGKFPVTNALFEIFVEQTGYVTTAEKFGYGLVYFPRMQRSRDPITGTERFILHNQAYSKRVTGACWHRPSGPDSTLHLKRTHPVVQVSLEDARAYAAWTGKRLPTEIEWEAAARTAQGLLFPWGNQWREDACNIEKGLHGDTTPVDQYLKFGNAYEVADMLGNVLEWTLDVAGDLETSETHIVKGASWISHDEISLADRHYIEKNASSNILGFRCVAI